MKQIRPWRSKLAWTCLPAGVSLLLLAGCASVDPGRNDFLTSYSGMNQNSKLNDAIVQDTNAAKLGNYDEVIIGDVRVFPPPGKKRKDVTDVDFRKLEDAFRNALREEFEKHCTITSEPAPGTLMLRAAVVDLQPGDPFWHVAGYAPFVSYASAGAQVLTGTGFGGGYATVQAELLDSVSNEQIFATIDKRSGSKLDAVEGLSKWGHVEKAFSTWAKRLVKAMKEAHETSS